MDEDDDRCVGKGPGISVAIALGVLLLAGAAVLSGPLGIAASILGGSLVGYGICTAGCSAKTTACPCSWPAEDAPAAPDAGPPTFVTQVDGPSAANCWTDRTARVATAKHSR